MNAADAPGVVQVGPLAEVDEPVLLIDRHVRLAAPRQEVDLIDLVALIARGEELARGVDVEHRPLERRTLLDDLAHRGLDRREVLFGERPRQLEVVVEAVLDRRAESEPRPREQLLNGLRQHMGRRVPEDVEVVIAALGRDDRDVGAVGERAGEVADLAVNLDGERGLRESRADRGRGVLAGGAVLELQRGAVGQGYGDHDGGW